MNDWLKTLVDIQMGAVMGILVLCALILTRGGFFPRGYAQTKPTKLQRLMGWGLVLTACSYIPTIINDSLLEHPLPWLTAFVNFLGILTFGFIPLHAIVLRQQPVRLYHIIKVYAPTLPLLLTIPFCESYPIFFLAVEILAYLHILVLVTHSLFQLKHWDEIMLENYSDVVNKQTEWYRNLMLPFFCIMLFWIPWFFWPEIIWLNLIYYSMECYIFVRFTTFALTQEEFEIEENLIDELVEDEPKEDSSAATTIPAWAEKMEEAMRNEHLYRQEDLTRNDLAERFCINRTYISHYLNKILNTTFYEYINNFRLDESEVLLQEGKLSITEIALQCGFRDRAAFYRNFAKRHGMSPSEWRACILPVSVLPFSN